MFIGARHAARGTGHAARSTMHSIGGNIMMKNEWIRAIILFIMLYAVLAFGNFGTGFQYVGF